MVSVEQRAVACEFRSQAAICGFHGGEFGGD
jgi:hypothetical protein